jgi:uncharacterized protein (TIGR02145 family)
MLQRVIARIPAIIVILIGLTASISYGEYVCGDANSDGAVNVSDAVFIINYVFVGGAAPDPNCCDDCPPTVTDYDGRVYQTVLIGDQCWMKENLRVVHYRNGDEIPLVKDDGAWTGLSTGAYCEYENTGSIAEEYGNLYNWYAVNDSRNIAPEGWHVPTDDEWQTLVDYLGGSAIAGGKLKETGTEHWLPPNTGATNESGFTALPGGDRFGSFGYLGEVCFFWSSTEDETLIAWCRRMGYNYASIGRLDHPKICGYSIRCIKD